MSKATPSSTSTQFTDFVKEYVKNKQIQEYQFTEFVLTIRIAKVHGSYIKK